MQPWKKIPTEEEYVLHSEMQGASRTFGTGFAYPDPSNPGTLASQAFHPYIDYPPPSPADTMAMDSHTYQHYSEQHNMLRAHPHRQLVYQSQPQATSLATNVWGCSGVSPYAANSLDNNIALDPSLRGDNPWNSNQSLDCYQQPFPAPSMSNQYTGSSFREPNMPPPGTNNVANDITNSIYHSITPSTRHAPQPTDYEVEGRESCPKGGKRRRLASGSDAHRQYVVDQSGSRSLKSNEKQGRSARSREAAPAHRVQVRNPKGPSSAGTAQKASNSRYDEVNGDKFILIGDEWMPAGHHRDFREKLIMMDAEQPGAPVFIKGMSLDYTSYSPVTSAWTNDPRSIRDSEGEEVLFLPARPPHLPWNPECGLLICEGLVMLDQDNVPIKDYPGAPRTLATSVGEGPGHLLQGLRSILGMTVKDIRARMLAEGDSEGGKRRSHGTTALTNRMDHWRWRHNLPTWHPRRQRNTTNTKASNSSKRSNEGKSASNVGPDLVIDPPQTPDGPGSETIEWDDF